ncbi:amidase family protein, partial [Burkholderia gladioli]|uniref:amidase family protein n=1 Tax=Burkholderia gladioli TaxID=28095 RepID=UPI001C61D592
QYRHNLFDRKALAFHGKPPPGSGSSLPQNSLSDWSRIPNADQVSALHVMDPTAPLNVTGLPGMTLRFGTSSDGLPIGVQIVAPWMAESTLLHLASLLEAVSPVRGLHPDVSKL